jgi:CheY-like chemotaxis protein
VKQLLTFSRQGNAVKKALDFTFVVQESIKLIRSSTPVNIKIEQNLSADTYPVMGNDTQINQLLINLCNNAIDALPVKGGLITIELLNETIDILQTKYQTKLKPGQYAKLIVSDNGVGMDKVILDRVFEPYFTTKDIGEGTGIGLAVVHGIVERHGGAIYVDSKPGQGTIFTIFLPAHEGLLEQETDEQDILPVGDECILYVDDEPSIALLGKRHLENLGYTAESTTDPQKALDMVRSDPIKFDLLITDMAMPNMTGDQLIIETLKIRQDMPTIICTGYSAKISEKEAADIGARSYIMKPINKSELATTVRKVLDSAKKSNLVEP